MKKLFLFLITSLSVVNAHAQTWTEDERSHLFEFSSSLLKSPEDSSNIHLSNENVIKFGEILFNDARLSSNNKVACSSCHMKSKAFTDGKRLASGLREGFRNTPTLFNVAHHDWFFADGAKDSLWAQALSSLENPAEQNFSRLQMLHLIASDKTYENLYNENFLETLPTPKQLKELPRSAGPNAALEELIAWKKLSQKQKHKINRIFINIGKSLAAYVATLDFEPTRFDAFLTDLITNAYSNKLSASEQRGLQLFMSPESTCTNCHNGPLFSNKSFHNIATGIPGKDNGRAETIESVLRDEFNCLSKFSDAKPEQCSELNYVNRNKHQLKGGFKTPTLRGIGKTAPYMHDGRFDSLAEVLQHYVTASKSKTGHTDLSPITLNKIQQADMVDFLLTL